MTKKAMRLAYKAHEGQRDKSGLPYIFHPFYVAEQMTDELSTTVALLHDVVEDTRETFSDLEREGFPEEVLAALRLLTRGTGEPYLEYIQRIKENPVAVTVKLADLNHNSDISRLDKVTEQDRRRLAVYAKAIKLLQEK